MENGEGNKDSDMGGAIWAEIERSESFLVCSMYEEAATLASCVIKQRAPNLLTDDDLELYEAMEAAGMVFVQSLKQLSRTSTILKELKAIFGSVEAIPVQVLLTGVCFQISEASTLGAREFLGEFLSKWSYVDEQYYVLSSAKGSLSFKEGCESQFFLGIDKYIEVVELYIVMLLETVSSNLDLAISWVENAALPQREQQKLLRRLRSLYSIRATNISPGSLSLLPGSNHESLSSLKGPSVSGEISKGSKTISLLNGENHSKEAITKLHRQPYGCLWWFRYITLKFGNYQLVISNGKILIGCLIFLMYYILRRKKVSLQRIIWRQVLFMKKSLVDLWQLAFSYQVNPLAAIQPLSSAT